jgi:hypothetical protein
MKKPRDDPDEMREQAALLELIATMKKHRDDTDEMLERRMVERERRELATGALRLRFPNAAVLEQLAALAGTTRKRFDAVITGVIYKAHEIEALNNVKKIPHKRIAHHAHELIKLLKASDEKHLSYLFFGDQTVSELILILENLAQSARSIGGLTKYSQLRSHMVRERHICIEFLLTHAALAGGRLTLDRHKESGSLFEAVELLKPFLPKEVSSKLSFSTQRRIYEWWLKTNKNWLKKASI